MSKKELFNAFKVYLFTYLVVIALFLNRVADSGSSLKEVFGFFMEALTNNYFLIAIHLLYLTIYVLFLIGRYFFRMYLKKGVNFTIRAMFFRFISPVIVLILVFKWVTYANSNENFEYPWNYEVENLGPTADNLYSTDGKHRGMSVFGWRSATEADLMALVKNNIEWVAVIPFCYQKNDRTKEMNVPEQVGVWTRRDSTFINTILKLHEKGIHVQLKPHLWMNDGWRSNIAFETKDDWNVWFASYRKNMLHYAQMAALTKAEMLCVGTELKSSLKNQPEAWIQLIREIKEIYHGKLTYAANWDGDFDQKNFWKELDYIGVQAYFPLTKNANPRLEDIVKGWKRHVKRLEEISAKHELPILFTEIGYKSEASATIKPWEWSSVLGVLHKTKSFRTQHLAYEAMFQQLWQKDWFAGTYIWQWDTRSTEEDATNNLDFSPRFKPAENTLAKWYAKSN